MVGLPFSGKTTKAVELADKFNAIRLTPDDWIVNLVGANIEMIEKMKFRENLEEMFISLAKEILEKGLSIILDFGFWGRSERDAMRKIAIAANADFKICYCECPSEQVEERINNRNKENQKKGGFIVTKEMVDYYERFFETISEKEKEYLL